MRSKIYDIIEKGQSDSVLSRAYDFFMMGIIILSLVPLVFKSESVFLDIIDYGTAVIFIIDYVLRLITADYKLEKGRISFIRYPFTPMAIIDLISILPTFLELNPGFKVLKIFRLIRTFKVFRVFKGFRYSKNFNMIMRVLKREKNSLLAVCALAIGYIIIIALIMFNVEPDTFDTFFDALYWATISLTTMGYGDIYAVSIAGRVITMFSALFGIAIVALPAGMISAGFVAEMKKDKKEDKDE